MQRLALEFGTNLGDIGSSSNGNGSGNSNGGSSRFGSIEYSANKRLCKSLGVLDKLPMVLLFKDGEQVDSYPCNAKLARTRLRNQLQTHHFHDTTKSQPLEELKFEMEMNRGEALLNNDNILAQIRDGGDDQRQRSVESTISIGSSNGNFGRNETSVATMEAPPTTTTTTSGSRRKRRFWPFSRSNRRQP